MMKKVISAFAIISIIISVVFLKIYTAQQTSEVLYKPKIYKLNSLITYKCDTDLTFKIKEPTYQYKNMKKISEEIENKNGLLGITPVYIANYKSEDNKEIQIEQCEADGKSQKILSESKKISIDGTDAWLYISTTAGNTMKQLMFWKNGMYYKISANIETNDLVNIAKSLN